MRYRLRSCLMTVQTADDIREQEKQRATACCTSSIRFAGEPWKMRLGTTSAAHWHEEVRRAREARSIQKMSEPRRISPLFLSVSFKSALVPSACSGDVPLDETLVGSSQRFCNSTRSFTESGDRGRPRTWHRSRSRELVRVISLCALSYWDC